MRLVYNVSPARRNLMSTVLLCQVIDYPDKQIAGRENVIGVVEDVLLFVVYIAEHENHAHIISAPRASRKERRTP
jgi:uncharacterized DUF497 family protein